MAATRRNARRLAEDAQRLLDHGRWASAASLTVLSIEESGKVGVLWRLSLASGPADLKAGWDGYGSHRRKLGHPLGLGEVFVPDVLLDLADALTQAVDKRAETVASMDVRKQAAFHTLPLPIDPNVHQRPRRYNGPERDRRKPITHQPSVETPSGGRHTLTTMMN